VSVLAATALLIGAAGLTDPPSSVPRGDAVAAASGAPLASPPKPSPSPAAASAAPAPSATAPAPAAPSAALTGTPRRTVRVEAPAIDRALAAWLKGSGSPGVSAAVLWPGGRLWVGAAGTADASTGERMTPRTALAYASVTKTFTAALVLQLIDDGELRLDQRVAPLLPDAGLHPSMTVRHLLDHTSGLPDMFRVAGIEPALNKSIHRHWTVEDALAFGVKDRVAPDTFWRYSNTGYVYLGELVERVTGKPWATLVRERLLDPLGLRQTFVQGDEDPTGPLARGHRVTKTDAGVRRLPLGDDDPIVPFASVVTAAGAAGAIAGTAEDAARWAAALYGGRVLSPAMVRAAVEDVRRVDQYSPRTRYGLGVQLVRFGERITWGHSGTFLGFKNQVRWLPNERIAVVVLTNQSRVDVTSLERKLIDLAVAAIPSPTCPTCR
jgi:D-alanyl-D-alanine carboxypeptidase